jgi:PKD repeat protein
MQGPVQQAVPAQPQPVQTITIQTQPQPVTVQPAQAPIQQIPAQPAPVQPVAPVPAPVQQPQPVQTITVQTPLAQPQPLQQPVAQPVQQSVRPAMPAALPQQPRPGMPLRPGMPQPVKPGVTTRQPPNPKKLLYGCSGCAGALVLFFIIFVLIFVAQTSATGENPLAKSLGVDTGSFINTLILLVNLVFGSLSVLFFVLVIIGLFRYGMARKDDKEAKRKGLTLAGVTGLLLVMFVFIWVGIYLFLSSKKVPVQKAAQTAGIITEPADTLQLTAPITIKFDGSKVPINANTYEILTYSWSFGDGQTSTVPVTSHTYKDKGANAGRYDVTLQVTKKDKKTNVESTDAFATVVTIANVELHAEFAADPESGPAPLTVSFDASASSAPAGEITAYDWDFVNNNAFTDATGVKASHTFDQVGTYKVNLRVTDNTGQFKTVTKEITVQGPNVPTPVIDIPTQDGKYYSNVQYTFLAEKSTSPNGKIEKFEWDFGDGSPKANTRTANHIYKTTGTFDVTLVVTDDTGVKGELSQKIKVETAESAPIAVITSVPAPADKETFITGTVPFEVSFDASKSQDPDNNIVEYKWDFDGDGQIDTNGEKVTYVYKQDGVYNATLTVLDAENNQSNAVLVVKVGAQPLQARITATPVEGIVPLTVTFDASSSSYPNGEIVSYEWDFGDGGPKRIDVSKVNYKYLKIGTFTAKVTAIASDNSKATAETPINVRPTSLTACFEASTEQGSAPLTVEFDPRCSTGTVSKLSWDFGDGETTRTRKPSHTFNTPGSYQVTLEVSDNQNVVDKFSKTILVTGTI